MIRTHSLLVILPIFFSALSLICFMSTFFSRQRHLDRGHRILCPTHHLERTDNKPFSGFTGSRYITKSETVAHQSSVARFSPRIPLFSCTIQTQCNIFGLHFSGTIKTITTMVRGKRVRKFNQQVKNGSAKFNSFPGCKSKEMLHYIEPTLETGF